jgi:hypothetical protein
MHIARCMQPQFDTGIPSTGQSGTKPDTYDQRKNSIHFIKQKIPRSRFVAVPVNSESGASLPSVQQRSISIEQHYFRRLKTIFTLYLRSMSMPMSAVSCTRNYLSRTHLFLRLYISMPVWRCLPVKVQLQIVLLKATTG